MATNVSSITKKYILEHPSILECIRLGLVNYSKLARRICAEQEVSQFDAVVVSLRRYFSQHKKRDVFSFQDILEGLEIHIQKQKEDNNLIELSLISEKELPGEFMPALLSRFFQQEIHLVKTYSGLNIISLVIEKKEREKIMNILS